MALLLQQIVKLSGMSFFSFTPPGGVLGLLAAISTQLDSLLRKAQVAGVREPCMNLILSYLNRTLETHFINSRFTWKNGRENPILCRLDRFLISMDWEDHYPHFFQEAFSKLVSNHWPIIFNTDSQNFGLKQFKFENMWVLHPQYHSNIAIWWNECTFIGREGYKFCQNFKFIKRKLIIWNKNTFEDIKSKKEKMLEEISKLDKMYSDNMGLPDTLKASRLSLLADLDSLLHYEEIYWKQKAKYKWLKEGDRNTKFFHKIASGRKRKNLITKLMIDGNETIDFETIANATTNFYESLFSQEDISRPRIENLFEAKLSSNMENSLEAPFTK